MSRVRPKKGKARGKRAARSSTDEPSFTGREKLRYAVLKQYCEPDVLRDFCALPSAAQSTMLESMRETIIQHFGHLASTSASSCTEAKVGAGSLGNELQGLSESANTAACEKGRGPSPSALKDLLESELGTLTQTSPAQLELLASRLSMWGVRASSLDTADGSHGVLTLRELMLCKGFEPVPMSLVTDAPDSTLHWDAREALYIGELVLFTRIPNAVLVGTVLTAPHTLGKAIYVRIEDDRGDVVDVCLDKHICGYELSVDESDVCARGTVALLSRIAIADPLYVIDTAGRRMIYVGSPCEAKTGADADAFVHLLRSRMGPAGFSDTPDTQFMSLYGLNTTLKQLDTNGEHETVMTMCFELLRGSQPMQEVLELASLLADRAQASLRSGDATLALRDAAATLVLCPRHEKGWLSYTEALRAFHAKGVRTQQLAARAEHIADAMMTPDTTTRAPPTTKAPPSAQGPAQAPATTQSTLPDLADVDAVLKTVLARHELYECSEPCLKNGKAAEQMRQDGDKYFRARKYSAARAAYTAALSRHCSTEHLAWVLWAFARACLALNSVHSALAVAVTCSALPVDSKHAHMLEVHIMCCQMTAHALTRLGRSGLGAKVMRACDEKLAKDVGAFKHKGNTEIVSELEEFAHSEPEHGGVRLEKHIAFKAPFDNFGPVELVVTPDKLGFVAKESMPVSSVVLVNRALVWAGGSDKHLNSELRFGGKTYCAYETQRYLRDRLVQQAANDPLLARALDHLDHAAIAHGHENHRVASHSVSAEELQSELQQALSPRVLPLLPQWAQYFPKAEHPPLLTSTLSRIALRHGCTFSLPKGHKMSYSDKSVRRAPPATASAVYPLASLLQHVTQDANCGWGTHCIVGRCNDHFARYGALVMTQRDVKAGEWLTIEVFMPQPEEWASAYA